jgi:hypothetical protein
MSGLGLRCTAAAAAAATPTSGGCEGDDGITQLAALQINIGQNRSAW